MTHACRGKVWTEPVRAGGSTHVNQELCDTYGARVEERGCRLQARPTAPLAPHQLSLHYSLEYNSRISEILSIAQH